jgi:hypothetical protein
VARPSSVRGNFSDTRPPQRHMVGTESATVFGDVACDSAESEVGLMRPLSGKGAPSGESHLRTQRRRGSDAQGVMLC